MKVIDRSISFMISAIILVFILIPFIYVWKEAFIVDGELSFSLFNQVFRENTDLLVNSLMLGILTTTLTTVVSTAIGVYGYLASPKIKKIILIVMLVTMISPPFVTSLTYINLFGRRGIITYHLLGLRISPYGLSGIVLMQTLGFIPLNSLIILSTIDSVNSDMIKSAQDLGADTSKIIMSIILPGIKISILSVFFLTFTRSLADFGTPAIIGGNFRVLALEGYQQVIARGNLNAASSINIMILLLFICLLIAYRAMISKGETGPAGDSGEAVIQRSGLIFNLLKVLSIFFIGWLVLQYSSIILSAFTTMRKGELVFTFDNLIDTKPYIDGAVIRSISYSLISAFFGSFLGLLIAYYAVIRRSRLIRIMGAVANLPYILPGTFFGLGYLLAFSHPPIAITGTSTIVVLNVLFKQLPFSARVMESSAATISRETVHSARDLGANYFHEFKDVVMPLTKSSLTVAFVNAFTETMTTVGSIIFLVYPGQKVLTLVMFDVINSGKYEVGSVIALLIILICLIVNSLYAVLNKGEFYVFKGKSLI